MRVVESTLEQRIRELGPWFHNLRLDGSETAPAHPLGDFPGTFFRYFSHAIPSDLHGKTALDVGCNAGFYSFELKRRGAARVLGIDHDRRYLRQAELAREVLGLDVEFRELDVYEVGALRERFDVVMFMGVLYHLRHPLYALERVASLVGELLVFQTMERGDDRTMDVPPDMPFEEREIFFDPRFPRLHFIERSHAGDATNWWIPNRSASEAMLRSVGMRIVERPCDEVYVCEPAA